MALAAAEARDSKESRYLESAEEIREAFLIYRDERTALTLRFAEFSGDFSANLLDVTADDLLLENLEPRSGMKLLRDGHKFSVSCRAHGQWVMAEQSSVYLATEERGIPYYHVKLPKRLLFQQRRRETRYSLPLRAQASGANLRLYQSDELGQVEELSCGGCRARFTAAQSPPLEIGELIPQCEISIQDDLVVQTDIRVRHCQWDEAGSVLTAGLEFTQMSVTDRRRLEQYVGMLERQQKSG